MEIIVDINCSFNDVELLACNGQSCFTCSLAF